MDVYEDTCGRQWKRSRAIPYFFPNYERPFGKIIALPFHTLPMWPVSLEDPVADANLCVCVYCNTYTDDLIQICLDFGAESWRVRVICQTCRPHLVTETSYCGFLLTVQERIASIINKDYHLCSVCSRGHCSDEQCKEARSFLKRTPLEEFLERMYVNRVDIVSCLRYPTCHYIDCERQEESKHTICGMCRRVEYCSDRCKREARALHKTNCVPFENLWLQ